MDPTLRKKMVIARPIGHFKNGDMEGDLTAEVIAQIVKNFAFKTQVPIFLWDHVEDLDEKLPDGWIESLSVNAEGQLVADVKLIGEAVALVVGDRIRQTSIAWRPDAKDYQGKSIGAVLQHLTLTNNPYIKDLPNIAAARSKGGEPIVHYFTALPAKETSMSPIEHCQAAMDLCMAAIQSGSALSDAALTTCHGHMMACMDAMKAGTTTDMKSKEGHMTDKKTDPTDEQKAKVDPNAETPTVAAMKAKDEEIIALKGKILAIEESLSEAKGALDAKPADTEKEDAIVRLKAAEFKLEALEVRELVAKGLRTGKIKSAAASGYEDGGYAGTITWLKASIFEGDKKLLAWVVKNGPVLFAVNKSFQSGVPLDAKNVALTSEENDFIRKQGLDPAKVAARA